MRDSVIIPAQRISGAMIARDGDAASGFFVSPDAAKIVYHADQIVDARDELFLVDVSSPIPPAPVRINGELVANGDTDDNVIFTPEGNFLVYWAEEVTDTV